MSETIHIFLLGASFMFCATVAWLFWRKGTDVLTRLVVALMVIMAAGFVKDLFVTSNSSPELIDLSTVSDLIIIPLYVAILYELCRPGRLSIRWLLIAEVPFVVLPLLLAIFKLKVFYYIDMSLAVALGAYMAVWTSMAIPKYHRFLKCNFSYRDDIDLRWLQAILCTFFIILTIWGLSCIAYNPWMEVAYMLPTLIMWIFVCSFLYKHESVVGELQPLNNEPAPGMTPGEEAKCIIFARIKQLIEEEKIYLDPMLKLSDIARMANTNRTYASAYFSSVVGESFYDHINGHRVEHAITLLADETKRLEEIAQECGFNSRQSFHRVFSLIKGVSPSNYRTGLKLSEALP